MKRGINMGIREKLLSQITMPVLQGQCFIIITLLLTLCLFVAWPRFRNDALSIEWYVYLIMAAVFMIPLFSKKIKVSKTE